jgi:hypothetical protein
MTEQRKTYLYILADSLKKYYENSPDDCTIQDDSEGIWKEIQAHPNFEGLTALEKIALQLQAFAE